MRRLLLPLLFVGLGTLYAQRPVPIIFDTDIGDDIDDALALGLALQSPELDVRAVTTVSDDVQSRTRLAWKELGMFHRHDIPVAAGAPEPLLDPIRTGHSPQFQMLTQQDLLPPAATTPAASLIVATLLRSSEKITLVPVGPLTNIALALKLDPRIKDKIQRIVLMGGAFFPPRAEYNIKRDRIAAEIVFRSGVPITAVGLDVTMKCKLKGEDLARLRAAQNPASRFLVRLIELWQNGHADRYPTLHDPLAVATTLKPVLIEPSLGAVQVETADAAKYGTTTFIPAGQLPQDLHPTTEVAREVNVRQFLDLFVQRLASPPRQH
ncbi:MAG TPA: nucleoside hydrolase [Bryobacteraceae bacterium]|nr:nucleoside hydrolase [Bryobacteraceae bacterium]